MSPPGAGVPLARGFSGSYDPADVLFLLKRIEMPRLEVDEKERLLRSGGRHYSEMLGHERQPSARYLEVFRAGVERNRRRFAADLLRLAAALARSRAGELTLVSLARAGTPVGVLLGRLLRELHGREAAHFSISIIRDRGIDENALRYLLADLARPAGSIAFVDGWTGKGVIAAELAGALAAFERRHGIALPAALHVVADLCGAADVAATSDDYLLPSAVLNATISGLVSRSVLNREYIGADDFHGCVYHGELEPHDRSRWFVEEIMAAARELWQGPPDAWDTAPVTPSCRQQRRAASEAWVASVRAREQLASVNDIKPGIGEATRALLRRVPAKVFVRDLGSGEVEHIRVLAGERGVPVIEDPGLPCETVALLGGAP